MKRFADGVSFVAASAGTGAFVQGTTRPSFYDLVAAVAHGELVDGDTVPYLAQDSATPTQREWGYGTFTASTHTIARTTILGGSAGPGVAVNFTQPPIVSLTALAEDLSAFRAKLTGNTTYYVSTTGSDSNPGTSGSPWATLQHAVDWLAANIDAAGFNVTIQLANGNYTGAQIFGWPPNCPNFYVRGNASNNSLVTLNDLSTPGGFVVDIEAPYLGYLNWNDLTFSATSFAGFTIDANFTDVILNNVAFTSTGVGGDMLAVYNNFSGFIVHGATVSGNWLDCFGLWGTYSAAAVFAEGMTLVGTPNFSSGFVYNAAQGPYSNFFLDVQGSITGAATGPRAVIQACFDFTCGAGSPGLTELPGSTPIQFQADGINYFGRQYGTLGAPIREVLAANVDFYVSTTGSDSNPGTSGSPWATLQHAFDWIAANIDMGAFNVIVQLADGTYDGFTQATSPIGSGILQVTGHSGNSSLVTIIEGATSTWTCVELVALPSVTIGFNWLTFAPATNSHNAIEVNADNYLVCVGNCSFVGPGTQIFGIDNSFTSVQFGWNGLSTGPNTISGTWECILADLGGQVNMQVVAACTLTGTPTFTALYILDRSLSYVRTFGNVSGAYTGALFSGQPGNYVDNEECGDVSYTVATLPSASVHAGARRFVADSTQTLAAGLGTAVVGGGANKTPVYSDGATWKIG